MIDITYMISEHLILILVSKIFHLEVSNDLQTSFGPKLWNIGFKSFEKIFIPQQYFLRCPTNITITSAVVLLG